jgi:periplasmic divalent cation tolerance protein
MPNGLVVAMTTCANLEQAERLARLLVEQRLAACVTIGQVVRSIYPWEGQVNADEEVPLMIKTAPERSEELKRAIDEHHPYEVPELLLTDVDDGLKSYVDWARDWVRVETRSDAE